MKDPIKVSKDVYLIGSDDISGSGDCCVYAIKIDSNKICLIDAGTKNASILLENIQKTPLANHEISDLILTHCHYDHAGAAHQLKEIFPKMKIYAHDWDTPTIQGAPNTENLTAANWYGEKYIPVKISHVIRNDKEKLKLGAKTFEIFHTPGHTPGSISIILNEGNNTNILFGQDIHGPFLPEFNSNIQDWKISMKKILALEADILCEGHFGIIKGKDSVRNFIRGHLQRN
ncbi:MBL fold metallo-hydrolase [Candidatus Lokiarchaeum ossiferum]|uniref:MBL fold metallo-hydrolase n=1 Tax=Candidatus Lokiarchaeum ossiferum TaxID=2951803 RepID=UPI00352F3BE6